MQHPTAADNRVDAAGSRTVAGHRRQSAGQGVMKCPGFLRRARLPAQPLPPEGGQVQRIAAPRQRDRMADAGAAGGQRLQPTGRLPLIAQALRGAVQRAGDGIKQPSAGRGARRVNTAVDGLRQQRPVALAQRTGLRVILPVRDKSQALSQQITPRLTRRQVAARQGDSRQPAEMFALAIVNPQALPSP